MNDSYCYYCCCWLRRRRNRMMDAIRKKGNCAMFEWDSNSNEEAQVPGKSPLVSSSISSYATENKLHNASNREENYFKSASIRKRQNISKLMSNDRQKCDCDTTDKRNYGLSNWSNRNRTEPNLCDFKLSVSALSTLKLLLLLIATLISADRQNQVNAQQLTSGQSANVAGSTAHQQQLHLNASATGSSIIIDQQSFSSAQLLPTSAQSQQQQLAGSPQALAAHLQPSFVYAARNKSVNFTHVTIDEVSGVIYVGATNWLFQLSAQNLRPELTLRTGPASENSRDCAPSDCAIKLSQVEPNSLNMHHASGPDLSVPQAAFGRQRLAGATMHTAGNLSHAFSAPRTQSAQSQQQSQSQQSQQQQQQQQQIHLNNYNKILVVEQDSRQLIVCGSLNQGACRKHSLGQISNFSELIPLPVASNDEHSSSVALIAGSSPANSANNNAHKQQHHQRPMPVMYVAATNSRLGPYREMVPAIAGRYLEPASRAMQIIEPSFTDLARIDISNELRDYYLVNYVLAFQHQDFVYFATVQRKSPLRQLEELGYITRLARLCLSDLSFQSYTEMTLECRSPAGAQRASGSGRSGEEQAAAGGANYNLLQDAYVTSASSHTAHQLGIRPQSQLLVGVFAQSKDHTTRSQQKSAICLFPMEKIEQKFNENIHMCYNGSAKARNMNYIAGNVNDCPKPGKAGNIVNFCSEPIKLNGSVPLVSNPVLLYEDALLTSVVATQAPTAPISQQDQQQANHRALSNRQHQLLIVGTSEGSIKRVALVSGERGFGLRALELESVELDEQRQEPILADLHLLPALNPQLQPDRPNNGAQYAIAATPNRIVKFRVNACRAPAGSRQQMRAANSSQADECAFCARLQDPFCGWCASAGACLSRDDCQAAASGGHAPVHWWPFDGIQCADYEPATPQYVALQVSNNKQTIDVNARLPSTTTSHHSQQAQALAMQLAQANFACHFDYTQPASVAPDRQPRPSGATTKALQARLNLHTWTAVIGCPLPPLAQRPQTSARADQIRVRLSVRLMNAGSGPSSGNQLFSLFGSRAPNEQQQLERELTFYDCSAHTSCRSCLSSNEHHYRCAWCPLSARCTFNASHPDFGCAASAVASTTPLSAGVPAHNQVRAAHLVPSLNQAQVSVLAMSLDRLSQCPASGEPEPANTPTSLSKPTTPIGGGANELLVASGSRRSIQVQLKQPTSANQQLQNRRPKVECLIEVEGAKARMGAKLVANSDGSQQQIVCQETSFVYHEETAIQRGQLMVILNDNQVIQVNEVILYKCHLFGVSPPALTSSVASGLVGGPGGSAPSQHSSAAWRAHELLQLAGPQPARNPHALAGRHAHSDCSLCANVERKYQCVWCNNQCQQADQCAELAASTCPPPRIDSIHPSSGPFEGGTLLTIEGSNLGSNEREIQDKISVGGEACNLVMYSVSTRIVCKTGPSLHGQQAATVFVGNKVGVTSAHEKFHYKAVHLTDVNPHVGPVSGGTRLYLTGSNLNIGSRVQIFLDDIPCSLDSNDISSNQITCITAPNLLASSMRITRLTLMIDNSTHHLPYPFTYQPDPIITNIEPAESFLSGGRLILISGQYLASPQSTKLMVYHEHKHNIINGTTCITQNETLITCLTPAISREMLANLISDASVNQQDLNSPTVDTMPFNLSYESEGLKLKMSLFMDDVRSVRNLDEYYHHLPHYLTYYEDPQLFRLPTSSVDYTEELVISGENLRMKQLDQDMLITIGAHICAIKSISAHQVSCEPPQKVAPIYDDNGRLIARPLLPIVALIGSNLRYQIGHMQYNANQYQTIATTNAFPNSQVSPYPPTGSGATSESSTANVSSPSVAILICLSGIGFIVGLAATFMFAVSRFRQSKAEREYKRIQLQMGSLDLNGQPPSGSLFDNIQINNNQSMGNAQSRALNYVGAFSSKKLFYQLNPQLSSFPPSPLTDISSLTGSNLTSQQHVVKLSSNGTIINSTAASQLQHHYNSANSNSSQSSPSSTRNSGQLINQSLNQNNLLHQQHQFQNQSNSDKSNLLNGHQSNGNSRNFNWTQEAPSTIVPYAVIEACNLNSLTLEGKNAIKEYV